MKYSIIPDLSEMDRTLQLTTAYDTCWEYNDFAIPAIYENPAETERRLQAYLAIERDRTGDTMHGTFLGIDLAAADIVIRNRSRELYHQSLEIGRRLGVKGVVFHTGLIGSLRLRYYLENWLNQAQAFWTEQCDQFPELTIYMENSFEQEPDVLVELMQRMENVPNFKICLDYGHAILTPTPIEVWCGRLAPYIGHMHLNDNDLRDDLHLVPGQGKIDFVEYRELMERYKIQTTTLIELKGCDNIEQSLKYMTVLCDSGE